MTPFCFWPLKAIIYGSNIQHILDIQFKVTDLTSVLKTYTCKNYGHIVVVVVVIAFFLAMFSLSQSVCGGPYLC